MTKFKGYVVPPKVHFKKGNTYDDIKVADSCSEIAKGFCATTKCTSCIFSKFNREARLEYFDYLTRKGELKMEEKFDQKKLQPGDYVLSEYTDKDSGIVGSFIEIYNINDKGAAVGVNLSGNNPADNTTTWFEQKNLNKDQRNLYGVVKLVVRPTGNGLASALQIIMAKAITGTLSYTGVLAEVEYEIEHNPTGYEVVYKAYPEAKEYSVAELEKFLKDSGKMSKTQVLKIVK